MPSFLAKAKKTQKRIHDLLTEMKFVPGERLAAQKPSPTRLSRLQWNPLYETTGHPAN
jgi:hypothetical protein